MEMDSKYREILVAARRARQIEGGAPKLVESRSRKACKVALEEIRAGKIDWVKAAQPKTDSQQ